ncbi:hypothetical protein PAXRUDRAFT_545420 [Paxillus rubicundulus Ve08.2h10]|uniref:Uncharacterized protein n=1 Tax=Paxillus rubicundulus Ve08.2h10 TaxID=930991 RepID=A0A0D0E028_9AGAM|nr:hypothetical protein PAXRUDRAFT_545420 [Paxillus rubicundulus Ve08.2h10]
MLLGSKEHPLIEELIQLIRLIRRPGTSRLRFAVSRLWLSGTLPCRSADIHSIASLPVLVSEARCMVWPMRRLFRAPDTVPDLTTPSSHPDLLGLICKGGCNATEDQTIAMYAAAIAMARKERSGERKNKIKLCKPHDAAIHPVHGGYRRDMAPQPAIPLGTNVLMQTSSGQIRSFGEDALEIPRIYKSDRWAGHRASTLLYALFGHAQECRYMHMYI